MGGAWQGMKDSREFQSLDMDERLERVPESPRKLLRAGLGRNGSHHWQIQDKLFEVCTRLQRQPRLRRLCTRNRCRAPAKTGRIPSRSPLHRLRPLRPLLVHSNTEQVGTQKNTHRSRSTILPLCTIFPSRLARNLLSRKARHRSARRSRRRRGRRKPLGRTGHLLFAISKTIRSGVGSACRRGHERAGCEICRHLSGN